MALQYKLDAETFETLEDGLKANYKQEGNVYLLDVEGIDNSDVSGLKAKVEQLLGEKKDAVRKAAEQADSDRLESDERARQSGDYKQLLKSSQEALEAARTELQGMKDNAIQSTIQTEAQRLAGALTNDTARGKLLAKEFAARLAHTDEGIKVTDETGNLTVSSIEELATKIKNDFPFLIDGSQSSGGAATGSKGGALKSQKQATREDFDAMDHSQRADFVRDGGSVNDD
jgi:hypothetical protein